MTEPNSALPSVETTKPKPKPNAVKPKQAGKNTARVSLFLSVIVFIIVCLGGFYFWQKQVEQSIYIQQLLSKSSGNDNKVDAIQQTIQQQLNSLNDLNNKQQTLLNSLAQESYLQGQKLSDLGARSRNDWLLAEAEYLMHLANQRLTLEQDINSAEAMLTSADKIIEEINDPGLFEVRQALAKEIVSLQQVSHLDFQGLYLKLDALIASLDQLKQTSFLESQNTPTPVTNTPAVSEDDASNSLLTIWSAIWHDLKQAVSIRRLDQPVQPLLAPDQHYYLKQNLRLMLEQANLALLDKNTAIFQSSIQKSLNWLEYYFEQTDPQIKALQSSLNNMATLKIDQALPDISTSLRLTKTKIESFYKQHSINKLTTPEADIQAQKNAEGSAL